MDTEVLSITDEYSYAEDLLETSDCSFSESSEEQNEADLNFASGEVGPNYISALDFSLSSSADHKMQNLYHSEFSCFMEDYPFKINQRSGYCGETYLVSSEQKISQTPETLVSSSEHDPFHIGRGTHNTWSHSSDYGLEARMQNYEVLNSDLDGLENACRVSDSNKDQHWLQTCASSKTFNFHLSKPKYDSTFFSMNPILNRSSFFDRRTILGERGHANHIGSYFDFTSVKDPVKTYAVKLVDDHGPKFGAELPVKIETSGAGIVTSNHPDTENQNDVIIEGNGKLCNASSPPHEKDSDEEHLILPNVSGGSTWESLLGRSGNIVDKPIRDDMIKLVTGADMPLDFVIKKCVLDEILHQYPYIYILLF